jgi:23S rRNA G2069 N7-methylase RlmK/C1962 C5-methylase RlmI
LSKRFSREDIERHAVLLVNRIRRKLRVLSKPFERRNIGAFRIYDRDIPEVRCVADWYEGRIVLGEYVREQTEGLPYLETLADALSAGLPIPRDRIRLRERRTRPQTGERYRPLAAANELLEVREGPFRFLVDLDSRLDTGLFSDHRKTRLFVKGTVEGLRVLNLFGYTGAFTVAAASGGASHTLTIDASPSYTEICRKNLALNGFTDSRTHTILRQDVFLFLRGAIRTPDRWDFVICDPPSFTDRTPDGKVFDIQKDHPDLVRSILPILSPEGRLLFSTNHQRFEPRFQELPGLSVKELTQEMLPEDYEGRTPHRSFLLTLNRV